MPENDSDWKRKAGGIAIFHSVPSFIFRFFFFVDFIGLHSQFIQPIKNFAKSKLQIESQMGEIPIVISQNDRIGRADNWWRMCDMVQMKTISRIRHAYFCTGKICV